MIANLNEFSLRGHNKTYSAPTFIAATYISFVFLSVLISAPAYADKITIPYAFPVSASSVTLWDKCKSEAELLGCRKLSNGEIPASKSDFETPPKVRMLDYSKKDTATQSIARVREEEESAKPFKIQGSIPPNQTPLPSFEEKLLVGFTDFLVDRTKQEARLYLQEQLTEHLCEEDKNTFQKTCGVLNQLKISNFSMSSASALLRTSIREDLRNYPVHYFENKYSSKNTPAEAKKKLLYARVAVTIYRESRSSRDISEIIGGLAELQTSYVCETDDAVCIDALGDISKKARVYWTLSENLRMLRENLATKKIYDENRETAFRFAVTSTLLDPSLESIFGNGKNEIAESLSNIVALFEVVQKYREQIAQVEPSKTEQVNLDLRLRDTLTGINALYQISAAFNSSSGTTSRNPLEALQAATELAQAIIEEDYSRIVLETVAYAKDNANNAAPNKYLPLMVELASAQSSADMQKIFELAAAPAGSYSEKFNSNLTSITALAGIAGTREQYGMNGSPTAAFNWQPFLPVGVQHTWKPKEKCGVYGLFVSLLDVGTLAMSRQGDSTVSSNSNTGWAQVFSPGLYGTYNLPSQPIVIGLGIARTPKLVTTNTGEQVSSTRVQVFFALDLTLFAFR